MKYEWTVAAFYRFHELPDCAELAERFRALGDDLGIKGTIIFAPEGVNSTIAGSDEAMREMIRVLRADPRLESMAVKYSHSNVRPFPKFKVKVKREIVTFRQPGADPKEVVGEYVEPEAWNELISDPDVVTIDTRNDYEVELGKFKGAVNPNTDKFEDFAAFVREHLAADKKRKVAMYCTGGIRCERATAFLKKEGFESVYHLKGGILKYLEKMPEARSLWEGDCFVFDYRVALDHGLRPAGWGISRETGDPIRLAGEALAERQRKISGNH